VWPRWPGAILIAPALDRQSSSSVVGRLATGD